MSATPEIKQLLKPITLPTSKMAKYLGLSKDFLLRNQDSIFKEGIHYSMPLGLNKFLWNVSAMEDWALKKQQVSEDATRILDIIS